MKRGNIWPAVQTRWVMGKDSGPAGLPPVWTIPRFSAIFFYYDDVGTPLFEVVDQSFCQWGRYWYGIEDSTVFWKAYWETPNGAGDFWFFQKSVNGDQDVYCEAGITFGIYMVASRNNLGVPTSGLWSAAVGQNFHAVLNLSLDFPWVNFTFTQIDQALYGDLLGAGLSTQETRAKNWIP